jgi:hypothetical protein
LLIREFPPRCHQSQISGKRERNIREPGSAHRMGLCPIFRGIAFRIGRYSHPAVRPRIGALGTARMHPRRDRPER